MLRARQVDTLKWGKIECTIQRDPERLRIVKPNRVGLAVLCLVLTVTVAVGLEVCSVPPMSPPELVVMPSGKIYLYQKAELELRPGETELALDDADGLDEQSLRLRVLEPTAGVSIIERYRRPDAPGKLFWKLRSTEKQTAALQFRYCPKSLTITVSYEAQLHPDERLMDLRGRVTTKYAGETEMKAVSIRLPSGDSFVTTLTPATSVRQDLFDTRGIIYAGCCVYDEKTYGKQVMYVIEFTTPQGGRSLPGGPVVFYSAQGGLGKMLGAAAMPYSSAGSMIELPAYTLPNISVSGGMTDSEQQSVKVDVYKKLALYNLREEYEYTFFNRGPRETKLIFRAHYAGDWQVQDSSHEHERIDADTVEFSVSLPRGQEVALNYTVLNKNIVP